MDTKQTVLALIGMTVGLLMGALIITGWNAVRYDRQVSDQCWITGGTYTDGTCETMDALDLTDQEKVCVAMKGTYIIKKQEGVVEEFTCYRDNKELEMPDLTGKEVIMLDDTVILRDK